MKMKTRYLVYAVALLLFYILAITIGGTIRSVRLFLDPFAMIMVLGSLFIIACTGAGFRTMSDSFYNAFSEGINPERFKNYVKSERFFRMMEKSCLYLSALIVVGSLVAILSHTDDKSGLGKGVAFGLLGLVYSLLLRTFLFQPLGLIVRRKIIDVEGGQDA